MGEFEKRTGKDRRKQATPGLSRYSPFGQRKGFRRRSDQEKGGYVDRYSPRLLFILVLIAGLNVLDALLTMMILELEGFEANPVVLSAMCLYGENFWIWKYAVVSVCLILLCLHSWYRPVKPILVGIGFIYLATAFYQLLLITY